VLQLLVLDEDLIGSSGKVIGAVAVPMSQASGMAAATVLLYPFLF
jgi:hypothetical protein